MFLSFFLQHDSSCNNNLCDFPAMIGFGGGGKFALYLDSSLEFGSSDRSDTFDNDCLAGSREFKCIKLEAWGFV